ncbi:MAG: PaaI family thioesterase [Bacillota bacterium]
MDKDILEFLYSMKDIPYHQFLGFEVKSCAEGRCIIEMPVTPNIMGPYRVVHGGIYHTMCEIATFVAATSALPKDKVAVTTDINISVLKSVSEGKLLIEAWVLKLGKRSCFMECRITDDSGQPVAAARASKMIISKPGTV